MNYRKMTEAEVEAVKGYLAEGFSRRAIAAQLGVSKDSIDRIAVPDLYAKRVERQAARRKEKRMGAAPRPTRPDGTVYRVDHHSGKVDADANRLLAQVPVDTRTPMQIQMGEPMPERSALYRKQMGGTA